MQPLRLIKASKLLAYGSQMDYPDDTVVIDGAPDNPHSGMADLLTNSVGGEKICVGAWLAGKTFVDLLNN